MSLSSRSTRKGASMYDEVATSIQRVACDSRGRISSTQRLFGEFEKLESFAEGRHGRGKGMREWDDTGMANREDE